MPRSKRKSPTERKRRNQSTTGTSVAEAFIRLVSRAAAFGMGFDTEGIEMQRDVEIVEDISLRPTSTTDEETEGEAVEASPISRTSPSSRAAESAGEKEPDHALDEDAAEPNQQDIEDDKQGEVAPEVEELGEQGAAQQGIVMVSATIEEEETVVEEIVEGVPSSSSSVSSPTSPADYSYEVTPPRDEIQDEDEATVDIKESEEVVPDVNPRGVSQVSTTQEHRTDGKQLQDNEEQNEGVEHDHGPDQEDIADTEQSPPPTKEATVSCKHCGNEFAQRKMSHHESECEVHQQKTVQESQGGRGADDDELTASTDQNDSNDVAAQDATMSASEEAESSHQDEEDEPLSSGKNAPLADDEQPRGTEGGRAEAEEDGFRLLFDPLPGSDKPTKAECLDCGKVLVYRKSWMSRHAKSCLNRAAASEQDEEMEAAPAEPQPPAPKLKVLKRDTPKTRTEPQPPAPKPKVLKRKLMSIEDALTAADAHEGHSPPTANDESDKTSSPPSPLPATTALQTPRRSKRIRRDPSHSPMALPIQESETAEESTQASSPPPPAPSPRKPKKSVAPRKFESPHADKVDANTSSSAVAMQRLYEAAGTLDTGKVPIFSSKSVDDVKRLDHETMRLWLFGTPENAGKMKERYHDSAQSIHSPCSRFQQLIHETLFGLSVVKLLDHLESSTTVTLIVDSKNTGTHRMGTATIVSTQEAQVMYDLGLSISFPATKSVDELIVGPLAQDLKASPLVDARMHEARAFCCRAGLIFNWRFHQDDCFVFQLKGNTLWKTKRGPVRFPARGYHPQSSTQEEVESHSKVHVTSVHRKKTSALLPPVEDYHMEVDQDDDESELREVMLEPGSVVYMPAGTWFEAEVGEDATFLEVHIASVSPAELVSGAVKQLLLTDEQWRKPISGSLQDIKASRKRLGHLLKDLGTKISSLSPYDLLPEALLSTGDDPLTSKKSTKDAEKCVDIDIRRHAFKGGKHIKVYKHSGFRENPLAVLVVKHEIPDYSSTDHHGSAAGSGRAAAKSSTTPKKALEKKPKRKAPIAARTLKRSGASGENAYVVHVEFGNSEFRSKLRVQFQCDPFQAAIVEWIRDKDGARFHSSDALKFAHYQPGKPHDEEDATKYVLRFLSAIGFLSPVKMPSE